MFAAATRAWYLPRWVRSPTPATSPMAQMPSPARRRSSTRTPRSVISTPSCSSPSPSTFGRRPVATSSARTRAPRRTRGAGGCPSAACSTCSAFASRRTRMPSCSNRSRSSVPASASSRASTRSWFSTSVTSDPIRRKNCASSTPTAPPPSTTRLVGHHARPDRVAVRPVLDVRRALRRGGTTASTRWR